jgi:penicillin-binding protein 1A
MPERSVIEQDAVYDAVITEVKRGYAKVRIGAHDGVIPLAWSDWVYPPDAERSWKYRAQDDLTRAVDDDGDGKKDGGILRVGDVVKVRVRAASTRASSVAAAFKGTPGDKAELVAVELWQVTDLESALWSMDLATGAVRAMVGGTDFQRSQLNRTTQAYRQVGSTFKPIVYAAGIEAKKLTAATKLLDAELAIVNKVTEEVWKPKNYDGKFLGSITLRKALALSRNVCTVRAVEMFDPKMSEGVVYNFVRRLGIGGLPTHLLGADHVPTPANDHFCPWTREVSKSARWCQDRFPPMPQGVTLAEHKKALDAGAEHWCRECDLSLALGSASLTMEELTRAYAVFPNGGVWREPYYIEKVMDRDGQVIHQHQAAGDVQVVAPEVATIMNFLLEAVAESGTAAPARAALGMHMAGKTGTTSDEKDMWFVGYTPGVITTVWVGYDQPKTLGQSSTGGAIALPIWVDYMRQAVPKEQDREFAEFGEPEWATIDDGSGRRTDGWGRRYPFLEGTVPALIVSQPDSPSLEDLATEL